MEQAMRTKTRTWDEVTGFYRMLIEEHGWGLQPMIGFVESISRAPWASKIHATTSHATLVLAPRNDFLWAHDMIRVDYVNGEFVCVHFQTPWEEDWTCRAPADKALSELETFAKSRGWA